MKTTVFQSILLTFVLSLVAFGARAADVYCCSASGDCSWMEDLTCETTLAATTPDLPAADQDFLDRACGNEVSPFDGAATSLYFAVDSCDAATAFASGGVASSCVLREVIWLDSTTSVAGSQALVARWPYFSTRPEAGHPAFQDPQVGGIFRIKFDARYKNERVIFAAQASKGALCAN